MDEHDPVDHPREQSAADVLGYCCQRCDHSIDVHEYAGCTKADCLCDNSPNNIAEYHVARAFENGQKSILRMVVLLLKEASDE